MFNGLIVDFFMWNIVINIAVLIWWFFIISFAGSWVYKLHSKWIPLSKESFYAIHYGGIAAYKLFIFFFLVFPYIVVFIIK